MNKYKLTIDGSVYGVHVDAGEVYARLFDGGLNKVAAREEISRRMAVRGLPARAIHVGHYAADGPYPESPRDREEL